MTFRRAFSIVVLAGIVVSYNACSGGFSEITPQSISTNTGSDVPSGTNVMAVTVGACGVNGYINEPCVSVTICQPGTNNCQTIPNILLDTGSYGLRIFSSLVSVPLTQISTAQGPLYTCAQFADGSSDWGPVKTADVVLGGLRASNVPIEVINSSAPSAAAIPSTCPSPDDSPATAGFNGILGVGLFDVDCNSSNCPASAGLYFTCTSSSCSASAASAAQQITNPVALLPTDNNGVILQLPSVATGGSAGISGQMVIGIGTRSNNTVSPSAVTYFPADQNGDFITMLNGQSMKSSFIDSGSNGFFFPQPTGLTACASNSNANGFYCPASTMNYSATQQGATGTTTKVIGFSIINATAFVNSGESVSPALGGTFTGVFDWGLPFFLGRNVYVGIDGKASNLGSGPYWAY